MKKITLCGSTKHKEGFEYANRELTTAGYLVYSVGWFSHRDPQALVPTEDQKIGLDLVHLMKILESDMIVVIDKNGSSPAELDAFGQPYIGDSTRREIVWANLNEMPIFYVDQIPMLVEYGPLTETTVTRQIKTLMETNRRMIS